MMGCFPAFLEDWEEFEELVELDLIIVCWWNLNLWVFPLVGFSLWHVISLTKIHGLVNLEKSGRLP